MRISDEELELFKDWKPGDRITIDAVSIGLLIQEVRQHRRAELLPALKEAYRVMNYLGDVLNGMDCVQKMDIENTASGFEMVRAAIAKLEAISE